MLNRPFRPTQGAAHLWWVLAAVECGNFVVYMDGFIVTQALPAMAREFGVGLSVLKWVIVAVERRAKVPLLDLRLFRSRAFTCGSISAAFYFVAAVSCYFLLPLYAQVVLRKSPTMAGVLLVPLSLVLTATSLTVGRLSGRFGARVLKHRRHALRQRRRVWALLLGPRR